jgi:hypothetical protein
MKKVQVTFSLEVSPEDTPETITHDVGTALNKVLHGKVSDVEVVAAKASHAKAADDDDEESSEAPRRKK